MYISEGEIMQLYLILIEYAYFWSHTGLSIATNVDLIRLHIFTLIVYNQLYDYQLSYDLMYEFYDRKLKNNF